jgi:biotin transport system substrate-specific component
MLMGLFLNVKNGVISIVAYLILGAIGLPVFASGMSGLGVLFGPTGGFLFSFIIAVIFVSIMKNVNFINNEIVRIVIILLLANVIIYFIGWTWFAIYTNTTLQRTLGIMSIYILGDLIKIVMVTYAYLNIRSYVTYERT